MRTLSCLTLLAGTVLLAGCGGGASEMLGLGRHSPDEFAVVDRAPLSVPPDFALRPPKPGAPRPQEIQMTHKARKILFAGQPAARGTLPSGGTPTGSEKAILNAAGATKADPSIRATIDREADQRVVESSYLVDELLWWRNPGDDAAMVDAPAEAKRLRDAKKKAEPLTKEPTPIIEKQRSGWLF